jgi:hypothetical protein
MFRKTTVLVNRTSTVRSAEFETSMPGVFLSPEKAD